jgi:hypothetical protein
MMPTRMSAAAQEAAARDAIRIRGFITRIVH